MTFHYVCILVLVACGVTSARKKGDMTINTLNGRVRGIRYHFQDEQKAVDCYLGIPFAKAPIGHLRYRHPEPVDRWNGVLNATQLPNSCYQVPDDVFGDFRGSTMWNPNTRISEDCLYLNIWVPKLHPKLRRSAVLVWIFGGGFTSGTPTLSVYDGKILAAENNIIVASIGYRVGALGFLSLGIPDAPGNAGLFDQLMGLEWIQKNIRAFGGDPENITLFGESAGSVSVSMHLLSPLSREKFSRAILQSGTANMPWATYSMDEAKRRSKSLAFDYLGCSRTHDMQIVIDCLRGIAPQRLVEEQWVSRGIVQFPFVPVIDGSFLVEHPMETLKKYSFKKCPILIGSNLNEASFFLLYELESASREGLSMSRAEFLDSMHRLFAHYPQYPEEMNQFGLDAVIYQYSNYLDVDEKHTNYINLDNAVGDMQFTCNSNTFAYYYAAEGGNVYAYYFTEDYSSNPWPQWMGVLHGDEIMFVFGEPFKPQYNYTREEKELSRQMMRYWTNFAKTGSPNEIPGRRSVGGHWPLHTVQGREYLELHSKYVGLSDTSRAIGRGPRAKECAFWSEYLPSLVETTKELEEGRKLHMEQRNWTCEHQVGALNGTEGGLYVPRHLQWILLTLCILCCFL